MTESPREFAFTPDDFARVRKLIHDYAGIALNDSKHELVYSRLTKRLRALGLKSFHDYLQVLTPANTHEMEAFVNALTTNLTGFFREEHHFSILAEHLRSLPRQDNINIWCAACSTGEEPYSIGMTLMEYYDSPNPPARIIATDLDTSVLEIGQRGVYRKEQTQRLSPERLKRFFVTAPELKDGELKVRHELNQLVTFRQANLMHPMWPVRGPLDAIFCRNVMIYFDRQTQLNLLRKFVPLLKPTGLLFVGHSENLMHANELFRLRGQTVYQLANSGAPT